MCVSLVHVVCHCSAVLLEMLGRAVRGAKWTGLQAAYMLFIIHGVDVLDIMICHSSIHSEYQNMCTFISFNQVILLYLLC